MTYSLTRFAIYETMRDYMTKDSQGPLPFYSKVLLGGISGKHWVVGAKAGQRQGKGRAEAQDAGNHNIVALAFLSPQV